ncbi:MAG: type 2 isopentenyl-diphosphate Delta-isomerase, partial [Candidatus Micrarchaeia archaeon]
MVAKKTPGCGIQSRKKDHVEAAREGNVEYEVGAGFSDLRFVHDSLPELDLGEIDSACIMFKKKLSSPLLVAAITGGYPEAGKINLALAKACEEEQVAFGLGSQRAMIERPELASTYKARKVAPSIPIIGNIGGCQLEKYSVKKVREALDAVEADALAIHLNPLQEICQPEGDSLFRGIGKAIGAFARDLGLPVIVKETGAGISRECAAGLSRAGVRMIDVAGAGGTSWSKEEYMRSGREPVLSDWGNPTCECIAACSDV